jgi:hypothetical protein
VSANVQPGTAAEPGSAGRTWTDQRPSNVRTLGTDAGWIDPSNTTTKEHITAVTTTTTDTVVIDGTPVTPTHIDGIYHWTDHEYDIDKYVVTFTLYVDADTPEQASSRAMGVRECLANGNLDRVDHFYWHLHDHDGC